MNGTSDSMVTRLIDRALPRTPDFYGLMNEQCCILVEAMDASVEYIVDGGEEKARKVREIEKRGDELKARSIGTLNRVFATIRERKDLFRAIVTLNMVIDYAKTTVQTMDALEVQPDKFILEIAVEQKSGAQALREGFRKLTTNPAQAEEDACAARNADRNVEKIYAHALTELFKDDEMLRKLDAGEPDMKAEAMHTALEILRRREIYSHQSKGAEHLAWAADCLHDLIVKAV